MATQMAERLVDEQGRDDRGRPRWLDNLTKGVQNALEMARVGRLTEPVFEPYTVVHRGSVYRLRHYAAADVPEAQRPDAPLLLVPPLMVTAEIYDMSPESTAVGYLTRAGVDTYVIDFGKPEIEEGGLARTLDDHVLAVNEAVDVVREQTGSDVHMVGYSQGGMFIYQCAAYRKSAGIRSIVTFGSPVDVHRNLPAAIGEELAPRFIESVSGLLRWQMGLFEGIPAVLSRNAFRLVSARKEVRRFIDFVGNLHDREALKREEARRMFLGGEGFVAWPGPALRNFFEQFIVENRMSSGGFVIDGRTLTLADVTAPILYFVGENDEFARPPSVRAIRQATTEVALYEASLRAGHLGLVVGTKAMEHTWPAVRAWLLWRDGKGPQPELVVDARAPQPQVLAHPAEETREDVAYSLDLLVDTARDTAEFVRRRLSGAGESLSAMFDNLRWQVPRLAKLERIDGDTRVSVGLELAQQAARMPDNTFFLWEGRAHSYADADRRVGYVAAGLISCGVKRGELVGVLMQPRPAHLTVVAALSRVGAVAVLLHPDGRGVPLSSALDLVELDHLVTDPEHAERGRDGYDGQVLVLGGGARPRELVEGVVDMERIDPEAVKLPAWYEPNPGRASELATILFATGKDERPRAARITNWRWAMAAYGAAAASTLTSSDTVYCCMPLHHAAGLLVSVGGALAGGARLALGDGFRPETFWSDVRRYGASVVYYAGEMCRPLVDRESAPADPHNPVRLFAGSGMRSDVWRRLVERFDVDVLEFYATTEGNAVLANVSGHPVGSLGRPLPGSADVAIVDFDFERGDLTRDSEGWARRSYADQPGMLLAQLDSDSTAAELNVEGRRIVRDVFRKGDAWLLTGDVLRIDSQGHYWFVDRAADMIHTPAGPLSSVQVEDALYECFEIRQAVAYDTPLPGTDHDMPVATVVVRDGYEIDPAQLARQIARKLDVRSRPQFLRLRGEVPLSEGFRPKKALLRAQGLSPDEPDALAYDAEGGRYVPLDPASYAKTVEAYGGRRQGNPAAASPGSARVARRGASHRPKVRRSVPPPDPGDR